MALILGRILVAGSSSSSQVARVLREHLMTEPSKFQLYRFVACESSWPTSTVAQPLFPFGFST